MNLIYSVFQITHYVVCFGLILIILLQAGKSGGMAGIFGGGGSDQIFSAPSGKAFIKKLTIVMACIFIVTSIFLTRYSATVSRMSIIDNNQSAGIPAPTEPIEQTTTVPTQK